MYTNKITFVIGHLWQGGGERVCVNLANEFAKKGYHIDLVVLSLRDAIFDKNLNDKVNLINLNTEGNVKSFFALLKFVSSNKPEKILSFNYHTSFFLSIVKKIFKFKLISRSLNTLSKEIGNIQPRMKAQMIKRMIMFSFLQSDVIIAQSYGMKRDLVKMGLDAGRIEVIHNPINPTFYCQSMIEENNPIPYGDYILFCGRLSAQKGLHYLLKALQKIDPEVKLVIVGDGELKAEIELLADSMDLNHRVIFVGQQSYIKPFYFNAKCTVLSSLYEGFPNVLIESIAVGTPVVSFDCPNGPSEIIQDGVNGYLARYLDTDDLADKINLTLNHEFDKYTLIRTVEKFAPNKILEMYERAVFNE